MDLGMNKLTTYFKWLYRNSKGVRGALLVNVLLGGMAVLLNLGFIWICKYLVDIATGVKEGSITTIAIVMAVVMICRIAINAWNSRVESMTYARMNFIIRQRLYSNLLQSQWQGKEKMHSGDTLNRLFSDVDAITRVICQEFPSFLTTIIQLIAAIVFMCLMDWRLALILILIMPVFVFLSKVFFSKMRELTRDIRESESRVQSHIQESLQHKPVIQSMEGEGMAEGRLDDLQQTEYDQVLRRTRFNVISRSIVSVAFNAGYATAFIWSAFGIWHGTTTYGMMTAFLQLVGQIQGPLVRLTRQIPSFIYATASIDRLMELEDAEKEERGDSIRLDGVAGIRIEGLSFRYPDGESDVLKDFSFDFKPGSKTAIVGETGVGKSTLIRLMLSLLRPTAGRIWVYDEHRQAEASPLTRVNIVYVPQGNTLLSGTIRANLQLGDPQADEARMWEALDTAAAGFVRDLPQGLDTPCGERGTGLSEGQAQRIAIARGLLRPGSILLLDEFSSSLDPETEAQLMENLTRRDAGKTLIFITHREKIAEYCENILKLG